jgi:hypothetical protein
MTITFYDILQQSMTIYNNLRRYTGLYLARSYPYDRAWTATQIEIRQVDPQSQFRTTDY